MSVVGFDFGNESCVIAVARRRGIDVLQNDIGKRKTASFVAFSDKQRIIGDEGGAQYMGNYKNTFCYFKRFLGKNSSDEELAHEKIYVPYKTLDIGGKVGFEASYDGNQEKFLPEQVSAAMLLKLKQIAEQGLEGQRVADCVIGVPCYWTDVQRHALLDAAQLAGLNVLRLMNETTAVALNYGILRPLPKDEARKVMFLDIGKCSTSASVVSFVQGKLQVLSTASDANLGGRDFDQLLVDHFAEYIKDKYKMDVLTNVKATLKLYKECERVKKILSANSQVIFNVEYIMNDTDVKGECQRSLLEELANAKLMPRVKKVIEDAVKSAGLTTADLSSVEVVGGTTRIPMIQKELTSFFGREVSKTCDADESVARGCALQCAMLSPAFRVREFEVQDVSPYAINVSWGPAPADPSVAEDVDIEQTSPLFTVNNAIPSVKMISFKDRTSPFQIVARYANPELIPGTVNPLVGRFIIKTPPAVDGEVPKIKVRVKINLHGTLEVTSAQALHPIEDVEMKPAAEEEKKDEAEAPKTEEGDKQSEEKPMDTSSDDAKEKPAEEDKPAEEKKEEKKEPAKPAEAPKKKFRREDLTVADHIVGGMAKSQMTALIERETAIALMDKVIAETNEARNALESYCLEMRSKAEDELRSFIADDVREKFCNDCTEYEDWLYEDGENAQRSEYKAKLAELAKVGDAAVKREFEFSHRENGVSDVKKEIGHWEKLAKSEEEKYSHITPEDRKKVTDACSAADKWLLAELQKLDKLAKHDDPSLTVKMLVDKVSSLANTCRPIMNKAKPPPPKKEEPKKEEEKPATDAKPEAAAADEADDDEMPAAVDGDGKPIPEEAPKEAADMEMD